MTIVFQVRFVACKSHRIVTLTPYIPVDETSERHAFAILLMYSDWGVVGEKGLLSTCCTAVDRLRQILPSLPVYVRDSIASIKLQETLLAAVHVPATAAPVVAPDDFDDLVAEENSFAQLQCPDKTPQEAFVIVGASGVILRNTSAEHMSYLNNYLSNMERDKASEHTKKYCLTPEEQQQLLLDGSLTFELDDHDLQQQELEDLVALMNRRQLRGYKIIIQYISNPNSSSRKMILFLSGPGGTG